MNLNPSSDEKTVLENARLVKLLGIVSVIASLSALILLIFGVLLGLGSSVEALLMYKKNMAFYRRHPGRFSPKALSRLKTGFYCALTGCTISCIELVVIMVNYGKSGLN